MTVYSDLGWKAGHRSRPTSFLPEPTDALRHRMLIELDASTYLRYDPNQRPKG